MDQDDRTRKHALSSIAVIAIILLLLLLLFWPAARNSSKTAAPTAETKHTRTGNQGIAKYKIISVGQTSESSGKTPKTIPLSARLEISNLSKHRQLLDYSMVEVVDSHGRTYPLSRELTESRYQDQKELLPWGRTVAPGGKVEVSAIFEILRGPTKKYFFRFRDFEPTSNRWSKVPIGSFDTLGEQPDFHR